MYSCEGWDSHLRVILPGLYSTISLFLLYILASRGDSFPRRGSPNKHHLSSIAILARESGLPSTVLEDVTVRTCKNVNCDLLVADVLRVC